MNYLPVSRWEIRMDNGFRRTWGVGGSLLYPASYFQASSTWGKNLSLDSLFSLIYLRRANRSRMRFSAMSCFTLVLLHAFGSCSGNCVLAWSSAGSCCPVKPQFANASHWAAPMEQLEVVQGHFNSSCYRTGGSLVLFPLTPTMIEILSEDQTLQGITACRLQGFTVGKKIGGHLDEGCGESLSSSSSL